MSTDEEQKSSPFNTLISITRKHYSEPTLKEVEALRAAIKVIADRIEPDETGKLLFNFIDAWVALMQNKEAANIIEGLLEAMVHDAFIRHLKPVQAYIIQ